LSNPFTTDGASAPLSVTRQIYEGELQVRTSQDFIMNSSPAVQQKYQKKANTAQTREAVRAGTKPEDDRWEPATTVVVIYACGSPRSYSAKNSDKAELQGVKNAYQNAVTQDMQVAMFTYQAQYPTFWEEVLAKTPLSYKWWSDNVKDLKMVQCNRLNPNDLERLQREKNSQSAGLALVEFLLDRLGISSTPKFKTDLVLHIFRSEPKKLDCTAVQFEDLVPMLKMEKQMKGLKEKIDATNQMINESVMTCETFGADFIDMIFVMKPEEAEDYFGQFNSIHTKDFRDFSLKEAAEEMKQTVNVGTIWDKNLEGRETLQVLSRAIGQCVKITLQLIKFGFGIKKIIK
jgi:hypothetical protein